MRRASRAPTSRSRRTPVRPRGSGGGLRVPWIPIALVIAILAVVGAVLYLVIQAGKPAKNRFADAAKMEEDPAHGLPGEYVNLPQAWANGSILAHYGEKGTPDDPNTNLHVTQNVDYSKETSASAPNGLPPAGGPHWGQGSCGTEPKNAPAFCGPVPWGIYRDPWHPENLVHNMEHSGVVVWYNFTDTQLRDKLEAVVKNRADAGKLVVMVPYPDIPQGTIALTAWARRWGPSPTSQYNEDQVKDFINKFSRRFNPEGF